MRRYIPYLILGVLTVGAVVGLILGLSGSHPASSPVASAAPSASRTRTTSTSVPPVGNPVTVETCTFVTAAEAKELLNQIVNTPPIAKTPFCQYEGIVTIAPSTKPPTLTVTAVTDAKSLASAENLIQNNVVAVCGKASNPTCASVMKDDNHVTIDGTPVIWRQSITTVDGVVGAAYSVKHGTVVVITVSGLLGASKIALQAMGDVLPRL
jgi:hypothetical protein